MCKRDEKGVKYMVFNANVSPLHLSPIKNVLKANVSDIWILFFQERGLEKK